MKKLFLGAAVAVTATLLFQDPEAHADPDTYLNLLAHEGIDIYNPGMAIAEGEAACVDVKYKGFSVYQEASTMAQLNPRLTYSGAVTEVNAALLTLC